MKMQLVMLLAALGFGSLAAPASANQPQPDGSVLMGGVRLYPKAPPPAQQRAACGGATETLLGPLAMSFFGVTPWITNHPLLERNCATLLDIPPVSHAPFRDEMLRSTHSWWTRVVRVRMPENPYGWGEALSFAWCAEANCRRHAMIYFTQTELVGFCSATPSGAGVTRYMLASPDDSEAWTYTTSYRSCIEAPLGTAKALATAQAGPGTQRIVTPPPPTRANLSPGAGRSEREVLDHLQARANQEQARREAQRIAQERAAAAAAWERMQRPNTLGW